jgi:septal ring factor EnvC (AmiA/AmiB activator)
MMGRAAHWLLWSLGIGVLLLGGGLVGGPARVHAQSVTEQRQSTERRLDALKEQIRQDQTRLREAAEAEKASRATLDKLQRRIALREELVSTYNQRLRELRDERRALRDTLGAMETRLGDLRDDYRARAIHAYKYGRLHDLALILASQSINQMLIRVRYLRRFAEQRRSRRSAIQSASVAVRARRESLDAKRSETEQLLAEAKAEQQKLRTLQSDRRRVIGELRDRRSELEAEIERKQSQAQQLEARIRDLVAAAEARTAESSPEARAARTSADASLSASFEQNQGRLPWPADGAVTESFGNQVDPVHGTTTYHPGILVATNPGSEVRAVFEGTVTGIDFVPGYGTYLVLRHGNYLSIYSNFSSLYVATGERVAAGQAIGEAGTDNEPRGAGVFFAVFDTTENTSVDPMQWLASR